MHPNQATCAQFFLSGLKHGLTAECEPRDWAFVIIENEQLPASHVIDVALSTDRHVLEQSLAAVPGERDSVVAGRMLLGVLLERVRSGSIDPVSASLKAVLVYRDLISEATYQETVGYVYENFIYARNEEKSLLAKCNEDLMNALLQEGLATMPNPSFKRTATPPLN